MKIKNLNPIELHIEKAILAVAVLAAGYLAYVCWSSPTMIEAQGGLNAQPLAPKDVETEVRKSIESLEAKRKFTDDQIDGLEKKLRIIDVTYAEQYKKALETPLDASVVRPNLVVVGPTQPEAPRVSTTGPNDPRDPTLVDVLVAPALEKSVKAEAYIGTLGTRLNNVMLDVHDARVVRVSTQYPMGKLRDAITNAKFPSRYQTAVIEHVEWQRQEKLPDGKWGEWKPVAPLKGASNESATKPVNVQHEVTAEDAMKYLTAVKLGNKGGEAAYWLRWLMGNMPAELQQPIPAGQYDREDGKKLFPEIGAAAAPVTTAPVAMSRPAVPATAAAPRAPLTEAYGSLLGESEKKGEGEAPATVDATSGDPGKANLAALGEWSNMTSKPEIDMWVYDDHLEAGREYRYRVRVTVYNPLFRWPSSPVGLARLKKEARPLIDVPNIVSAWTEPSNPVKMDLTDFFFVTSIGAGVGGDKQQVTIEIFRYQRGRWEKAIHNSAGVGTLIGISSQTSPVVPAEQGARADLTEKYRMDFTLVDIIPTSIKDGTIVFLDRDGQLVTRTISVDANDPQRKTLDEHLPKKALTPAPGTAGTLPAVKAGG